VATRAFEASPRASYHITTTEPVSGSTVTVGMNCDRLPSVKLSVIESVLRLRGCPPCSPFGENQLVPLSSEATSRMFVFEPAPAT